MIIQPDIGLIEYLRTKSGSDLSTCMQCGSCTAVCELSPEQNPFPRKEMIWAGWGLKDKLLRDPDIWLCHHCGDCSNSCPRDVVPGDVLSSLRNYIYLHHARPHFLGKWLQSPKYLPFIILIPAIIILVIIAAAGTLEIPEGDVEYSKFFPHAWLNGSFGLFVLLIGLAMFTSIRKYIRNLNIVIPKSSSETKGEIWKRLWGIILHKDFRICQENRQRSWSHMMVFAGFILLLIVTLFAILATVFFEYPLGFFHPVKITGNLAGILLLTGISMMMLERLKSNNRKPSGQYLDWFFLITMFLLTISGGVVELARFMNWTASYYIYFTHLLLVWLVVLFLPYSKFAHAIFRTVVLLKMGNRKR